MTLGINRRIVAIVSWMQLHGSLCSASC